MDILSWKLHHEEQRVCALISQSVNSAQSVALRTTELTALSLLSGAVGLDKEARLANAVQFESVKEKVRQELDAYVDQAEFIDLFNFVINMGADKSPFIAQLLDWGSRHVEQHQRRLRLQAFAEVNKLPMQAPRVKIALLMRAYTSTPVHTWCPSPESRWHTMDLSVLQAFEQLLHYFHVSCVPAVAGMKELEVAAMLAHVGIGAAHAVWTSKSRDTVSTKLMQYTKRYYDLVAASAAAQKPPVTMPVGSDVPP